NCFVF
ncbi:hypothetical protein CPC197_2258, partial [Chlamydia psittaci C1/97]